MHITHSLLFSYRFLEFEIDINSLIDIIIITIAFGSPLNEKTKEAFAVQDKASKLS